MRRLCALALLLSLASDAGPRAMRFLAPGGPGRSGCSKSLQGAAFDTTNVWSIAQTAAFGVATSNYGPGPQGSCSPSGTLRLNIGAVSGSNYWAEADNGAGAGGFGPMCPGGTSNISWGFWAKPVANGTLDFCENDNSNGWVCHACSLTAGTWTFCKAENQPWWVASNDFFIGLIPLLNGGIARGAIDVQVWGPRCVVAATISP